jgi:hypothetical protein
MVETVEGKRFTVPKKMCYVEFNPGRVFDDTEWRPVPALFVQLSVLYVLEALRSLIETDVAPLDWEVQEIEIARDIRTPGGKVPVLPRPPGAYDWTDYDARSGVSTGFQFQMRKERHKGVFGKFYDKYREAARGQAVPPGTWRIEFTFDRKFAARGGLATVKNITDELLRETFTDYFKRCRWDRSYPSEPAYARLCEHPRLLDRIVKGAVRQAEADGHDLSDEPLLRLRRAALREISALRLKIDPQKGAVVCVFRLPKHCSAPGCENHRYGRQRLCEACYRRKLRAARRAGSKRNTATARRHPAVTSPKAKTPRFRTKSPSS